MSIWLPSRPMRKLLVSLLPEIAGFIIAAIFAHAGSNIPLNIVLPVLIGAIILAIIAEYYVTYKPIVSMRRRELTTFFKQYLDLAEKQLNSIISDDVDVRANIMLLKSRGQVEIFGKEFLRFLGDKYIQVEYVSDEDVYTTSELNLEFDVGQGCCGRVIEQNDQFISISPRHTHAWDSSWGTTEHQDEATRHLNLIIGTPIYRPNDKNKDHPIGVFIVDSEDDIRDVFDIAEDTELAEVDFKETEIANRAIEHARNVGILL